MQAEAIAKLKTEMDGNLNNHYIQVIGGFLLRHLETNPEIAEKILTEGKTIAKSLDAMKEEARKKQHNGVAMLTDAEGFEVVLIYFGIEGAAATAPTAQPVITTHAPKPIVTDFDVKLEDLL